MIKLLLVEDDASLCYMVKSSLEDLIGGYEVIIANNGKEGLDAWKDYRGRYRNACNGWQGDGRQNTGDRR